MDARKYGRTYHFPFSPGATSDDRILADWEGLVQHPLEMTEKLAGENTCLKPAGVYARSHAAITQNPWARNMWSIWERTKNALGSLEVFGENLYGIHSIEYERLPHHFFVFAIRDGDQWLAWDEVLFYAEALELATVPVFEQGRFTAAALQPLIERRLMEGSAFGGACEGFVFRNAAAFGVEDFTYNVLKYVRKNHVTTDEHWTKHWRRAQLWYESPAVRYW